MDDTIRTEIRLTRCLLEIGALKEAETRANSFNTDPSTKTGVQHALVRARLYIALGELHVAHHHAAQALTHAREKHMPREQNLLEDLLEGLFKTPIALPPSMSTEHIPVQHTSLLQMAALTPSL